MTWDPAASRATLIVDGQSYGYYSLAAVGRATGRAVERLPVCLKILLENRVRHADDDGDGDGDEGLHTLLGFLGPDPQAGEIRFRPMRVMMDDTAGLPLLGDLAAMRDAAVRAGRRPETIEPVIPVDFIVDHSIIAEHAGRADALDLNARLEFSTNQERFQFLRWAGQAFRNLRIVPPGGGICHQINLEYLATVVQTVDGAGGGRWLVPDSMVGIDSHTPMVNALGIVGWGVSGIEGVGAALGEAVSLRLPRVIGIELTGRLRAGITATDLVLTLTQQIRQQDLVGSFVEFFGSGLTQLTVPERATVANMAPECGTTMNYFPIDAQTLQYLRLTGREASQVERVEAYARAQGLWHEPDAAPAQYSARLALDLNTVEPSLAGPSQPHHRVGLGAVPGAFRGSLPPAPDRPGPADRLQAPIQDGDIVIAAITSCTNTSNPANMIGAGLLARNAIARGLTCKPWVKTSLSPGSQVVAAYLERSGLQRSLDALGFQVTGFGCMTCVGFSGALPPAIDAAITGESIAAAAVVSGNRNYDGRIHARVHASFLASPPLVVAYALAGSVLKDLSQDPLGLDTMGQPVFLHELWPDPDEVACIAGGSIDTALFTRTYATLYAGSDRWQRMPHASGTLFPWNVDSTFIRPPPEFDAISTIAAIDAISAPDALDAPESGGPADIEDARILAIFGDAVTTEHVSPMGPIPAGSLAADYLRSRGVAAADLGTYAARRLVPEVMARGTYSSPFLENRITPGLAGGGTIHQPTGERLAIFEAAQRYRSEQVPLVVVAGQHYGTGSSRDWSAKGPRALGVRAILAASFERLHRANLVAAGVLPLQFEDPRDGASLTGLETLRINGLGALSGPRERVSCEVRSRDGSARMLPLIAALETRSEVEQYAAGGLYRFLFGERVRAKGGFSERPAGV